MKVGVRNESSTRVALHEKRGWVRIEEWAVPTGAIAEEIEGAVITWWAELGGTRCEREEVPRSDGYTESVWIRAGLTDVPITFRFVEALAGAATHAEEALTK